MQLTQLAASTALYWYFPCTCRILLSTLGILYVAHFTLRRTAQFKKQYVPFHAKIAPAVRIASVHTINRNVICEYCTPWSSTSLFGQCNARGIYFPKYYKGNTWTKRPVNKRVIISSKIMLRRTIFIFTLPSVNYVIKMPSVLSSVSCLHPGLLSA